MRYLSVCSGIEAASVAWMPLGWECAGVSEIDKFPRAVLEHRLGAVPVEDDHRWQPGQNFTPLFGDFTKIEEHHVGPVDLLVGGTPCQSFSIAGKRLGLDDPRGNLTLEFLALARRVRARWIVWENVPGILSHEGGRTFGTLLGLLGECGYRGAYRVIDAQYARVGRFGRAVPQRRRRVFVIGYSGTADINPAAVLFDRESLRGNPAPRRQAGQRPAPTLAARTRGGGGLGTDFDCDGGLIAGQEWPAEVAPTLNAAFGSKLGLEDQHVRGGAAYSSPPVANPLTARMHKGINTTADEGQTPIIQHGGGFDDAPILPVAPTLGAGGNSLRAEGFDASEDGTGRGTPIVPVVGALACNTGPNGHDAGNFACNQAVDAGHILPVRHPVAIQERAVSENPDAGPDGKGWRDDGAAYTLEARATVQAVASAFTFNTTQLTSPQNGQELGAHKPCHALAAKDSGADAAETLDRNLANTYGDNHASTPETDAYSLLLKLREAVGEEAFAEWGLGISHSLQQADVLRSAVHGEGVRGQAQDGDKLVGDTSICSEDLCEGVVQSLWSAGCVGRASPRWQPSEQLAGELGAYLSKLSHQGAPRGAFLLDLWRAAQGLGVLREALSALEEARRPDGDENPSEADVQGVRRTGSQQGVVRQTLHEGQTRWGVRRLTPREAARLQGFPDDWARIPWRGKPAEDCPDGPQYKAYGNSMACNVMAFIGERIQAVTEAGETDQNAMKS